MNPASTIPLHTGNDMPVIGLGTWQLTDDTAGTIEEALRLGYRMIDTSGDYGTQPGIGAGLAQSSTDRSDVYIVSKVEEDEDAYEATKKNLAELDIKQADLMLIHRPPKQGAGTGLWEDLIRARHDDLTRDIGVSNYSIPQIEELIDATGIVPVVNQIEYSPFGHSDAMRDFAKEHDIIIQAYSPLTRTRRLDDVTLANLAQRHGKTPAQILIRWNLDYGTVPLPKANQYEHLAENIDVFDFSLTKEEIETLDALNEHYSALGSLPYVQQ